MTRITGITDVFFDLDHTLWDFDRNSSLAFAHLFEKHKIVVPLDQFIAVYSPINFRYWKYFREGSITKEKLRFGRLDKTFKTLGYKATHKLIDTLSDDYIAHLPDHNHLFEGTLPLLERLVVEHRLHIITNGFKEVQGLKLKNAKIDHYFDTVTTSECVGVKKPDPKIFYHALHIAGAKVSRSLMIGDTYEADILGAVNVGMRAICFNYHKADLDPGTLYVDHLDDLAQFI